MGIGTQPFMYDHPSKYSFVGPSEKVFNPRAASEASWRPSIPRPKAEGPLIKSTDFNRHPDSYFVAPYGNLNWKPMSPRVKDKVKWTRYIQLFLRVCSVLAAGGMLFCVICIRNTDAMTGWIIRVPAGIALLHAFYAIYHLARSSRGRTPASTASYMLFAAIIDVSLIPFYVFSALMARIEYVEPGGAPNRWQTLFDDGNMTYKVVYSTFLISVASGSLHLVSFILSLYLGLLYRKIARLPSDMNPLEENLTSRHKRNKSSLSTTRNSHISTATSNGTRNGQVYDPLISPMHTVPFMHTRNKSQFVIAEERRDYSGRGASRSPVIDPFDKQPYSKDKSNISLPSGDDLLTCKTPSEFISRSKFSDPTPGNRELAMQQRVPLRRARLESLPCEENSVQQKAINRSPTKSSSIYSTDTITVPCATMTAGLFCGVRSLPDDNWITHPSLTPSPSTSPSQEFETLGNKGLYKPFSEPSHFQHAHNSKSQVFHIQGNPLEMNPPTPLLEQRKQAMHMNGSNAQTPNYENIRSNSKEMAGTLEIGKARAQESINNSAKNPKGDGRVVSRSGVQLRGQGIVPNGGVRAREVSGKVMEEGREMSNLDFVA